MFLSKLKINTIASLFSTYSCVFSIQNKQNIQNRQSILKRYNQNQGWVYANPPLFQWFKHSIKQTSNGNMTKFNEILKLTSIIHISKYDSWRMLHQVSVQLKKLLNWRNFNTNNANVKSNLIRTIDLLKLTKNFNYQFQQNEDQNFIQQIKQKTRNIKNQTQFMQISQFFQMGLSQNKVLNMIQKEKLQILIKKIIKKQKITFKQEFIIAKIIKEGLISQFWSKEFLQQVFQIIEKRYKNSQKALLSARNAIKFAYFDQFQNQIQLGSRNNLPKNSQTEDKIGLILSQLDYNIVFGNKIFGFQLDYTIGQNLIIQYNGIHHYTTNSYKPTQTAKSKWKRQILQKRGFKVHVIPFYDWKQLDNMNKMKKYIISQIQNFILNRSKRVS